jgi:nicotinamidase/pyrazinamidase
MKQALILVDIQNDFVPGGALAVARGDEVVAVANRAQRSFVLIVATQDWHPKNHGSFASNHPGHEPGEVIELGGIPQVLWPDHCVQGTFGAGFHPALDTTRVRKVIRKGTNPEIDSYSGFFDNGHKASTGLGDYLRSEGVDQLFILGLATDYCVRFTALDARRLGFDTTLIEDGCRGVNLQPDDSLKAIEEMKQAGVEVITSAALGG